MRIDASVSGLRAHELMFAAGANNVANVSTPGFRAQAPQLAAAPAGGVEVTAVGPRRAADAPADRSDVALAEEMPGLIVAEHGYRANATAVRTQDEMAGALLDVLA